MEYILTSLCRQLAKVILFGVVMSATAFAQPETFTFYNGHNYVECDIKGNTEIVEWNHSRAPKYPELANDIFYQVNLPREASSIPLTKEHGLFQGIHDKSKNKWAILEKVPLGNEWTLFLWDQTTQTRTNLSSHEKHPLGFGLKPIAWVNETKFLVEGLYFQSVNEHTGVWEYDIESQQFNKLNIDDRYYTTPLITTDANYLVYIIGESKDEKLHINPGKIAVLDLILNEESKLPIEYTTTGVIAWTNRIERLLDANAGMRMMSPAFKFPWDGGLTKCTGRTYKIAGSFPGSPCGASCCPGCDGDHTRAAIDFGGFAVNDDVLASFEGDVIVARFGDAQPYRGFGNLIRILHTDGTVATYNHLNSIGVKVGDHVQQGCIIGKSGNTGCSTAPHLHFEVYADVNQSVQIEPLFADCNNSFPKAYYQCTSQNSKQTCNSDFSLKCTSPVQLACGVTYQGTTIGSNSNVSKYSCNSWNDPGPEKVHIINHGGGDLTASISGLGVGIDLDVFILSSCDANSCVGTVSTNSATYLNAPAGTYYIVVDGAQSTSTLYNCSLGTHQGHAGNYNLKVSCSPSTGSCQTCPNSDFNLSSSASWQTHSSSITSNGCKIYRFITQPGNTYTFKTGCGDGALANFNTYLELMNNSCTTVATNDDGCSSNTSTIDYAATGGYVYLKVKGVGTASGSYTLAHRYAPTATAGTCKTCPSYDYAIGPASTWATHSASITANSCKIYRVLVTSGKTYTFKTGCGDGGTANFDTHLELFSSTCGSLSTNDNGCSSPANTSEITWACTTSGYVFVKVKGIGSGAGNFKLAHRYVATSAATCKTCPSYDYSIAPSTSWQINTATITSNSCKIYRVTVRSGKTYTFKTGCGDGATANFDTYLELFTSSCGSIDDDDNSCSSPSGTSTITWTANTDGYVYLKVKGAGSAFGSYTIAHSYTTTPPCKTCPGYDYSIGPSSSWNTHGATLVSNGCKIYRVTVQSGRTYTFKTGCGDGGTANFDTRLELFDNSCGLLNDDDDGCSTPSSSSTLTYNATSSGYLYLKVMGSGGAYGSYKLAYRYVTTPQCKTCPSYDHSYTPPSSWTTRSHSLPANGCKIYRFAVTEGNEYTFKTGCGDGATANFDTHFELFDESCDPLDDNDNGCSGNTSIITWDADYDGYVYLKVTGVGSAYGNYTIAYRHVAPPPSCWDCANATEIECGQSYNGNTTSLDNCASSYPCIGWDESGNDKIYQFTPTSDGYYTFTLTNTLPNDFDIFLLSDCSASSCIDYDGAVLSEMLDDGTTYYIVVDGYEGDVGTYTLTVSGCLECSGAPDLLCGANNSTTIGEPSFVTFYPCTTWDDSGPEKVFDFDPPVDGNYTFTLTNLFGKDLDIFILDNCRTDDCVAVFGTTGTVTLEENESYYIVVDGYEGASGSFTLNVTCPSLKTSGEIIADNFGAENALYPPEFKIYPNPAGEYLNFSIEVSNPTQEIQLGLFDMQGKELVMKKMLADEIPQYTMNLEMVQSGIYQVVLQADGYRQVKRLIVNH